MAVHVDKDTRHEGRYELLFRNLFQVGRALAFPCDPKGVVDLDALSERAKLNYYYARSMIGREFAHPVVGPTGVPA